MKGPLQSSLDTVDAELSELALSVPLAQVFCVLSCNEAAQDCSLIIPFSSLKCSKNAHRSLNGSGMCLAADLKYIGRSKSPNRINRPNIAA